MFESNYNSELTIKKWAKILMCFAYTIIAISIIVALIMLFKNAKVLWGIALGVLIGGLSVGFSTIFASHLTWGFGDIVGNVSKKSTNVQNVGIKNDSALPEL